VYVCGEMMCWWRWWNDETRSLNSSNYSAFPGNPKVGPSLGKRRGPEGVDRFQKRGKFSKLILCQKIDTLYHQTSADIRTRKVS
jgi:hypothetical protein